MNAEEVFGRLLDAYAVYYNVDREGAEAPFAAEAVFAAKQEQFFLVKRAKLAEVQSNEYVYFAKREHLTIDALNELDAAAWERGMARVAPHANHKSSDVTLIVVANTIEDAVRTQIRKIKHSRTYKGGFWGFSNYRLAVIETSTGLSCYNGQGRTLRKLVTDICNQTFLSNKEEERQK